MIESQPTIEEVEASIDARQALLRHGADAGEFIRSYVEFRAVTDESGVARRRISYSPEKPISSEVALRYLPALAGLDESLGVAENANLDLLSTIGCTRTELGSVVLYLANIASL